MTRENEKFFTPELMFAFATAFPMRLRADGQVEVLWTLQKDRTSQILWTPPGGEIVFPKDYGRYQELDPSETAVRETKEEADLDVEVIGPPFYYAFSLDDYEGYQALIETPSGTTRHVAAHRSLAYYPCRVVAGEAVCAKQPDEPEYELVDLRWLTFEEFYAALESGEIKTFPNPIKGMQILERQLAQGFYWEALRVA